MLIESECPRAAALRAILVVSAAVLICSLVVAQEKPQETALTEEQIKKLISALGSDAWKERAEAQKKLIEAGRAAGPALEEATKSDDMEVAHRARKILDEICYLPDKLQAQADSHYEKLKSRDEKERGEAFKKLTGMGERVIRYLGKLLKTPSDKKVEVTLSFDRKHTTRRQPVDYTVTIKNAGKKPVWVPDPGPTDRGAYYPFGSEQSQITWSRSWGQSRRAFGFVHIAPGESFNLKRQFRPYGQYSGRHKLKFRLPQTKGVQYTNSRGEQGFLPVEHYSTKEELTTEIIHLPELVEGEKGLRGSLFVAALKVNETEIEKGAPLPLKFSINCVAKQARKVSTGLHKNSWYILLPVKDKTTVAAEGLLLSEKPPPAQDYTLEPGKSLEFDVTVKPEVEPGEYYLVCGYTELRAKGEGLFRGEIATNALKIKITAPGKEEKKK